MRDLWKNLLLALASLLFALCLVEFVLMPFAFPLIPLKLHAAFPRGARVLAQSSKAGAVPHDYIALLGDSYAQGAGDWLLDTNPNRNPPFHTAHLLRERTGRDVISFGASGAGSLRALVTEPAGVLGYLRRTLLFGPEDPQLFLVYFYEGNDVEDNVQELKLRWDPQHDRAALADPAVFHSFIEKTVIGESPVELDRRAFRFTDNFLLTRALLRGIGAVLRRDVPGDFEALDWSRHETNRATIAGREVPLPDRLQAPALPLSEADLAAGLEVFDQALAYLRERFPQVPVIVVYLPSPLSSYQITSSEVSVQVEPGQAERYSRDALASHSDQICRFVADSASAHGAGFIDTRRTLWPLAEQEPIHGPRDWKHFNKRGQEALVEAILPSLNGGAPPRDACASVTARFAASRLPGA